MTTTDQLDRLRAISPELVVGRCAVYGGTPPCPDADNECPTVCVAPNLPALVQIAEALQHIASRESGPYITTMGEHSWIQGVKDYAAAALAAPSQEEEE